MLKKILWSLLILGAVVCLAGGWLYWRYVEGNKPPISNEDRAMLTVLPLPAKAIFKDGEFELTQELKVTWSGIKEDRLERAWQRFAETLKPKSPPCDDCDVEIRCDSLAGNFQRTLEDESYTLTISPRKIYLHAASPYGILRGIETIRQLVREKDGKHYLPALEIDDKPRYSWRGILIDVGRHWIPKEIILRNLDAMAAAKMNVLHWHLTEYQGFRIESKVFAKLHELGSNGLYYTQQDIREVVAYAFDRGIRVVPEFDMPGHATSWFVGYPELASKPGPYQTDTKFGVLTPIMDPTKEEVYQFLDKFLEEMAVLFPDEYVHIGGDEVAADDWNNSEHVQQFMKKHGLKDPHDLQNYFNKRVKEILTKHGKKMIGWDEILHPDLGKDIIVQSWRSQKSLFEAVQKGSSGILSSGYYLDHKLPAGKHYSVDPEIMPGAVTITPDTLQWQQYALKLRVSEDNPMETNLILYGKPDELRGVFSLMDNSTGFEKAELNNGALTFTFNSEFGSIDVDAKISGDSIVGKMSLGLLSFPFTGLKTGGNDVSGTKPPRIQKINPLSAEDKKRILGGEAAMWTEVVSEKNIDSRLWPRAAAIAEKLWSPASLTKDTDDLYRRLNIFSDRLQERGLQHRTGQDKMMIEICGDQSAEPLRVLGSALEEAKYYSRLAVDLNLTTSTPLNEVVDAIQPESYQAYELLKMTERFLQDSTHVREAEAITQILQQYRDNDQKFKDISVGNPRLEKVINLSSSVRELSEMGLEAIDHLKKNQALDRDHKKALEQRLNELDTPQHGIVIAILPAIRMLVAKA